MRKLRGRDDIAGKAADLLMDESSLFGGWCSEAVWPESEDEASRCIADFHSRGVPVTVSGALTGVAGGAVPEGGAVVSTGALRGIRREGKGGLTVLAGTTMDELDSWIDENEAGWFYPPDPTESTASMGGTVATDASGSDSYLYGSTRRWVRSLGIVLPQGRVMHLHRGEYIFDDRGFCEHPLLGGLELPLLRSTPPRKNTAGYWIRPGMDLIDLFIGSEGTLGLVTTAGISLAERPGHIIDIGVFAGEADRFWDLFDLIRESGDRVRALEMMDDRCLRFMAENHQGDDLALPDTDGWVLLARFEADDDDGLDELLVSVEAAIESVGVSPDMVWGGFEPHERKRLRDFRHALPETVNSVIARHREACPEIHKLGTDSAVPVDDLREFHGTITELFSETGQEFLIFGHAGQGHLHANLFPLDPEGERIGELALMDISRWAVSRGGTVSAEHGIGRLKADLMGLMYSRDELDGMRRLRKTIDPDGLFAPSVNWP